MAIFLSSWNLILKRSSAHWRLIIAVILGVVLAVAITSSTILYFQSLRSIGLERDLVDIPVEEQVVQFKLQLNSSTEEDSASNTSPAVNSTPADVNTTGSDPAAETIAMAGTLNSPGTELRNKRACVGICESRETAGFAD